MKYLVAFLALSAPAAAQYFPNTATCPADILEIRDAGEGRAVVTYHNGAGQCSTGVTDKILTTPNGISVSVTITVNEGDTDKEGIVITPRDPGFQSFPPDGLLTDGETGEFLIQGGLS